MMKIELHFDKWRARNESRAAQLITSHRLTHPRRPRPSRNSISLNKRVAKIHQRTFSLEKRREIEIHLSEAST